MRFKDREDAARRLSELLLDYRNDDMIVCALPQGGAVLGYYLAKFLSVSLDLIIVRKINHPTKQSDTVCAVAANGHYLCSEEEIRYLDYRWLHRRLIVERKEAERREEVYLGDRKHLNVKNKIALLVDDGVGSEPSFMLAIEEIKHYNPAQIIAAIPVASEKSINKIRQKVDDLIVLNVPFDYLGTAGAYYDEFYPVNDEEIIKIFQQVS